MQHPVRLAAFLAAALFAALPAQAAQNPVPGAGLTPQMAVAPPGTLKQIIPGHYVYNSDTYDSGVIVTSEGVLVVDALGSEPMARDERRLIAQIIKQPVRYLVSSTFHDNYTRGNVAYTDAVKIGHINYRDQLADAMKAKSVPQAEQTARLPTLVYEGHRMTLHFGGKEIQIIHPGKAHTRGDSIVFVPADRIVYMSELFFYDRFPWINTGYVHWIEAIDAALMLQADIFVPSHGEMTGNPLESRAALIRFRKSLEDFREAVQDQIRRGATEDQAVAAIQLPEYKTWVGYDDQREVVIRRMYQDIKGTLQ